MDEDSIVSALQADLQNYKVKTQIRRKESQLHILLTRAEGDDVDYAVLYDIVKCRIDKLTIDGADSLIVYGRLAGAKHPEWQQNIQIKPQLPLIELDLEELENLGDIDSSRISLGSSISIEPNLNINDPNTRSKIAESDLSDELKSFKSSIEHDLEMSNSKAKLLDDAQKGGIDESNHTKILIKSPDFEPAASNSQQMTTADLNLHKFIDLEAEAKDTTVPLEIDFKGAKPWQDEEFDVSASTILAPVPMPLPPPTHKRDSKSIPEKEQVKHSDPKRNALIFSVSFVLLSISIVGICGWLMWDRSNQQQSLANARNFSNQALNPQKFTKLETLTERRNELQTIISQLKSIPNRPASLYTEAQDELTGLQPQLISFDLKVNIEQEANKKLESAKNITIDAAKITQNPPHKSTIWQTSQEKRQQALKMLGEIPRSSLLYADAQKRLITYRAELAQVKKWLEIQKNIESLVSEINPAATNQLKQLKAQVPEKSKFISQCQMILQPQISNASTQKVGTSIANVSTYLCGYFWE